MLLSGSKKKNQYPVQMKEAKLWIEMFSENICVKNCMTIAQSLTQCIFKARHFNTSSCSWLSQLQIILVAGEWLCNRRNSMSLWPLVPGEDKNSRTKALDTGGVHRRENRWSWWLYFRKKLHLFYASNEYVIFYLIKCNDL